MVGVHLNLKIRQIRNSSSKLHCFHLPLSIDGGGGRGLMYWFEIGIGRGLFADSYLNCCGNNANEGGRNSSGGIGGGGGGGRGGAGGSGGEGADSLPVRYQSAIFVCNG